MIELCSANIDAATERVNTAVAAWEDLNRDQRLKTQLWRKEPKCLERLRVMQQELLQLKRYIHNSKWLEEPSPPGPRSFPDEELLAYFILWGVVTPEQALDLDAHFAWYSFHSSASRDAKEPDL